MFKYLQIETTTACNAKCWFCPNHAVPTVRMKDEMIYSIIDSTRGMGITYRPFGLGEPFIDKRMPDILEYIKQDETARIEINTNGELLTDSLVDKIIDNIDIMHFSIDGIKRHTFDEVRKIDYDNVYVNTKNFINRAKGSGIKMEVRMIDLPDTEDEQQEFCDYWNDIYPGIARITKLYNHPWEGQNQALTTPCLKVYNEAFVYVHGTVHLCPWDFGHRAVIGNVKDDTIVNIWNSHLYERYRGLLAAGRRCDITLCSRCDAEFDEREYVKL
jgi:radical SAM protein with 4Fe4S-binding SPASM domain